MTEQSYRDKFKEASEARRKKQRSGLLKAGLILLTICVLAAAGSVFYLMKTPVGDRPIAPEAGTTAPATTEEKEQTKEDKPQDTDKKEATEETATAPKSGADYHIVIDKSDFKLYLYEEGKDTPIRTFGVAIGAKPGQKQRSGDMTTPTGSFTVDEIDDASSWTHDFKDGKGVIEGAYGPWFISLKTGWDGIGIHGTHAPESIGTMASEGCVRLKNPDIATLKKFVKVGTKVEIRE